MKITLTLFIDSFHFTIEPTNLKKYYSHTSEKHDQISITLTID